MDAQGNNGQPLEFGALRFWERGRAAYTGVLTAVLVLWVAASWPHFRPALTLGSLAAMLVLGLGDNLCYCAAYPADAVMRSVLSGTALRRARWSLWALGMLLALLLENYWIADEIYPNADHPPRLFEGSNIMTSHIASNMNFPAPLAVLGFLAVCGILFVALSAALIFWFARKPRQARTAAITLGACAIVYFSLLLGFSATSRETVLPQGQEKYFCEIDCHLAYAVTDSGLVAEGRYTVTLRTRFDETTTSPSRPKDVPLTPSPREVRLIDASGREYAPLMQAGTALLTPLKPGDSYTTQMEFDVPRNVSKDATGLRLLLNTTPAWPDRLIIGDENSLMHKKTYFAL